MPGVTMRETTPGEFAIEFDGLLSTNDESGLKYSRLVA